MKVLYFYFTIRACGAAGVVAYRVRSEPLPGQQGELDEITVGPEQTYAPLERLTAGVEYIISVRTVMGGNREGPPAITIINSGWTFC